MGWLARPGKPGSQLSITSPSTETVGLVAFSEMPASYAPGVIRSTCRAKETAPRGYSTAEASTSWAATKDTPSCPLPHSGGRHGKTLARPRWHVGLLYPVEYLTNNGVDEAWTFSTRN